MYCAYCGSQNQDGVAYCGNCGKPIMVVNPVQPSPVVQQAVNLGIVSRSSKGFKVGSSGAALVILCFFLPWILVSCGGQTTRISGWDLATGAEIRSGFMSQPVESQPGLFLVLLAGLGVIALAYFAYKRCRLRKVTDGFGLIVLGAIPLAILLLNFVGAKEAAAKEGIYYIDFQLGLWGTIIGFMIVIVGGVLNLRE